MSRVASRIYALLSVIRQQMSPFDPFRGGGSPKGDNVPFFYRFFSMRASLMYNLGDEYCESQNLVMNWVPNLVMYLVMNLVIHQIG